MAHSVKEFRCFCLFCFAHMVALGYCFYAILALPFILLFSFFSSHQVWVISSTSMAWKDIILEKGRTNRTVNLTLVPQEELLLSNCCESSRDFPKDILQMTTRHLESQWACSPGQARGSASPGLCCARGLSSIDTGSWIYPSLED